MEDNYTVYMHISPSGKRYIGITSKKPEYRWNNGKGYIGNKHFTNAIEKYGWDNFEHIIIATDLSEEQAKAMEIELIAKYDSTNPDKGYNITLGGEGTTGWIPSEETIKKMSEAKKGKKRPEISGENHPMYGKNPLDYMTEEVKKERGRKISEGMKGKNKGKNPRDYMTEEAKREHDRKVSEANSGENHPRVKSVIAIINNRIFGVFDYIKQGAEYFGCNKSHISNCCRGKLKSCGKYNGCKIIWKYLDIIEL